METFKTSVYRPKMELPTMPSKLKMLTQRMENGYPMSQFCMDRVGLKTILEYVGRLTDFKGVFVIVDDTHKPIVVGESEKVLSEILKLTKSSRVKDQQLLKKIAMRYGFHTALAGKEYLKSMQVNWLEVGSKPERILLKRSLTSKTLFTL